MAKIGKNAEYFESPCKIITDGRRARYHVLQFSSSISAEQLVHLSVTLAERMGAFTQEQSTLVASFACVNCDECKPLRVDINTFSPTKKHKKTLERNRDLTIENSPPNLSTEHTILYQTYLRRKHPTADDDINHLKKEAASNNLMLSLRDNNGKLLAFSLAKESEGGIIGENTAYDLSESSRKRSLGTLMELKLIEHGLKNDIPYLYIGALNLGSDELGHKGRYNASEIYNRHTEQWIPIPRSPSPNDLKFNS